MARCTAVPSCPVLFCVQCAVLAMHTVHRRQCAGAAHGGPYNSRSRGEALVMLQEPLYYNTASNIHILGHHFIICNMGNN